MESFCSQVKPSLTNRETISIFLSTLKIPYIEHMIRQVTANFSTFTIIGERIEDDLKNGKLTNIEALQTVLENNRQIVIRKPKAREESTKAIKKVIQTL